jgi:biopolymer transport protein ExbB
MARSRRLVLHQIAWVPVVILASVATVSAQDPVLSLPEPEPAAASAPRNAPAPPIEVPITTSTPSTPTKKAARPEPTTPLAPAAASASSIGRQSVLRLFTQANPLLWPLVLCSVVTVGYALERLVALRRERVIPHDFVTRFLERLATGKLDRDRAAELCKANDSTVARVFTMVVSYWGQPAATIRQALGYDAAGEVADLKRNIRVLNGTATLAPLLGLLGTVVGMIQSFEAVGGRVGTAKGEALAHGISLALVATALGLGIAIISVTAYYYLLNRVDVLTRELDDNARKVIDLVAAESIRPTASERRPNFAANPDLGRHEPRSHRSELG